MSLSLFLTHKKVCCQQCALRIRSTLFVRIGAKKCTGVGSRMEEDMKPSGIGGQAVIEGVMMRNKSVFAVAVRTPEKKIVVEKSEFTGLNDSGKIGKIPVLRGVTAFIDSLRIGMKTLTYSASFYEEEEEKKKGKTSEKKEAVLMGITMVAAVMVAVAIFILLPFYVSTLLEGVIPAAPLRGLIEGVIRVVLFIGYVKAISMMEDIRRVFMYHGAEHKTINCVENGLELTVENVKNQSRVHKRCGTSFLLVVMLISILFFLFIVVDNIWLRMLLRLVLIPVIAGVAYEFIKLAGRSENKVVEVLSKPGLWLQGLTTKEPDENMIEVAIASVEAVFDWKDFIGAKEEEEAVEEEKSEEAAEEETVEVVKEETVQNSSEEIEMVDIEEDEDEILKALDRFFEDPLTVEEEDGEDKE